MKYFIIATGYNCKPFVRDCFNSILSQPDVNFEAVLISDGSSDGTGKALLELPKDKKIKIRRYRDNIGAAYRRWQAIKDAKLDNEDVIVLLGLDDMLKPNALKRIDQEYDKGAWMTYGTWERLGGSKYNIKKMPDNIYSKRDYRKRSWIYTAPNTFKKFLTNAIKPNDLKYKNGKWLDNCTDLAWMCPCLEQCINEKIHGINDSIYIYRIHNNSTLDRFGKNHKTIAREWLKTMPIKQLYEK